MSGIVGALAEAWSEIRHHKLRVLLSLIGIAVSVAAITVVIALADYQRQYYAEQSDRYGGRPATISVQAMSVDGSPVDAEAFDARFQRVSERFGFTHAARVAEGMSFTVQLPDGARAVSGRLIDPAYAVIHRTTLREGRWFTEADTAALAPPVVVSEALWERIGSPPVAGHPTVLLTGAGGGTYQVVGVTPREYPGDEQLRMTVPYQSYRDRVDALPEGVVPQHEVWVAPEQAAEIGPVLAMDLRAGLPAGQQVMVHRTDWAAQTGGNDPAAAFETIMTSIAGLVLLLGALSLVNIQLVAMRQRVREIGVRRAFGASGSRVFFSVLLESLVATTLAGIVGIVLVVAVLRGTPLLTVMFSGLQDVPAFPFRAALTGLIASVAVGALAGFLPALVATRVKVIDAIRF